MSEKQVKRGLFIGSEEFRERLDDLLMGKTRNDSYRGVQRREHDVWEAERLLTAGLEELGLSEVEILAAKSVCQEKQALAWLIHTHTAVTGKWLSQRLHVGHPVNTSRAVGRFRKA